MTKEEKQLLLKDLCARLPYGVIARIECFNYHDLLHPKVMLPEDIKLSINNIHRLDFGWKSCKPYLRPMSSMTDEEKEEFENLVFKYNFGDIQFPVENTIMYWDSFEEVLDYLISHHFDYRGLIPMGFALEATEGMYKTE